MGPDDFIFVSVDESRERVKNITPKSLNSLEEAVNKLELLLENGCNEESEYQSLIEENPWMLGAEYAQVDSHLKLDDENIPDFTGLRVHDNCRDVIEIKAPFLTLFRRNGGPNSNFNDAWNQTENYVDFTLMNKIFY